MKRGPPPVMTMPRPLNACGDPSRRGIGRVRPPSARAERAQHQKATRADPRLLWVLGRQLDERPPLAAGLHELLARHVLPPGDPVVLRPAPELPPA